MDNFIGTWKLETNENFDKFLKYYKYGWLKIQAALISNIDLTLTKTAENQYNRIIDSTFMKATETYNIDGQYHANSENVNKKHTVVDEQLHTSANTDDIEWNEITQIINDKLVIERRWVEGGNQLTCKQIFVRAN